MIDKIRSWYLERAVANARKRYYDCFNANLSEDKLSKLPVPGIIGELKGSDDGQKREHYKKFLQNRNR